MHQTPTLATLVAAERNLLDSLDAASGQVDRVATTHVDAALTRLRDSVSACRCRVQMARAAMASALGAALDEIKELANDLRADVVAVVADASPESLAGWTAVLASRQQPALGTANGTPTVALNTLGPPEATQRPVGPPDAAQSVLGVPRLYEAEDATTGPPPALVEAHANGEAQAPTPAAEPGQGKRGRRSRAAGHRGGKEGPTC